jgi:hypothetical protein
VVFVWRDKSIQPDMVILGDVTLALVNIVHAPGMGATPGRGGVDLGGEGGSATTLRGCQQRSWDGDSLTTTVQGCHSSGDGGATGEEGGLQWDGGRERAVRWGEERRVR